MMKWASLQRLMDKLRMLSEKLIARTNTVVWSLLGTVIVRIVLIIVEIIIKWREV